MTVSINPMFLDGNNGRIFALQFCPNTAPRAHILFLPPFCEEMNRCRHLVADQAMRFAISGYSCLILDFHGTGDSEGELTSASWNGWRADALVAVQWCQQSYSLPVILWGLRLGALMALDLASTYAGQFRNLLLWQPVTNGKTYLTQVLRARIAYLVGNELPSETTEEMRLNLRNGRNIEVAGYVLGGQLAGDIDSLNILHFSQLSGVKICWLQQTARSEEQPSAAIQKVIDQLERQGNNIELVLFHSPLFWQLSERADCHQLLEKTSVLQLL